MKKILSFTLKLIAVKCAVLGAMAVYNSLVFRAAARLDRRHKHGARTYKWRYGKISYIKKGAGDPLLLVHGVGVGADHTEWERNIEELAGEHTVYAPDLLGFGRSDKPDAEYSAYLYTTLINDFIYEVIGAQTNIIASGGGAAFAVMAHLFKPQYYKKLLLVSPEGLRGAADAPGNLHVWVKWLLSMPVFGTFIYNVMSSRANMPRERFISAHIGGSGARLPLAAFVSRFLHVSIVRPLEDVNVPLCVAWGGGDEPGDECFTVEKANPAARLVVFEGAKKQPHREQSGAFNKLCLEFFD